MNKSNTEAFNSARVMMMVSAIVTLFALPNHGKHRPDDNEERHKCHHQFLECGEKCVNDIDRGNYNHCVMECFRHHKECVEKFED